MILYHGSNLAVKNPDISFSRDNTDFGKGFYTTPIKEQAIRWSNRIKGKSSSAVVSIYEADMPKILSEATVLEFDSYSESWLDFITGCRLGENVGQYDVIIGGVANDKVFDTIQLYLDGLIDKAESIKRLRYDKPNLQYCFRSQGIIDKYLKFTGTIN